MRLWRASEGLAGGKLKDADIPRNNIRELSWLYDESSNEQYSMQEVEEVVTMACAL